MIRSGKLLTLSGILLLISACTQTPQEKEHILTTTQKDTVSQTSPAGHATGCETNQTVYRYEPVISILTGTLTKQQFWGPPGYGEDTTIDAKEICFILELDKPIRVEAGSDNEFNAAQDDVKQIQLLSDVNLNPYLAKSVVVKGSLFGAQTGHHHTSVLLSATQLQTCSLKND